MVSVADLRDLMKATLNHPRPGFCCTICHSDFNLDDMCAPLSVVSVRPGVVVYTTGGVWIVVYYMASDLIRPFA
eukprot:scaffold241693_cov21-Prasinocladus_malaysianus.AAC.1